MIKIELEFATGAEARQALTDLLGLNLSATVKGEDLKIRIGDEKIAENFEAPKMEVVKEEMSPEVSTSTKKRRTKAEIEADRIAQNTDDNGENIAIQQKKSDIQDAASVAETNSAVTAVMLQEKAVNLIRNGKKELVVAIIKKFGGESISQADKTPLKPEVYADVMDELNKL